MSAPTTPRSRRPVVILRPVPGDTVIHRMWPGTKLIAVAVMGALVAMYPLWPAIAVVAALSGTAVVLARVPRSALPSIPRWAWGTVVAGGVVTALAGGAPIITLGSIGLPLGGLLSFLRFGALTIVILGAGALVAWTTHVADVAPAVAVLLRPLARLRVPVDDWAAAIALGLRSFPMLIGEFRVLFAARRMRPRPVLSGVRARIRWSLTDTVDLLAAAITVALRRADEMGDAITARGGAGRLSAVPSRPQMRDWVTIGIVVIACGTTGIVEFLTVGIT